MNKRLLAMSAVMTVLVHGAHAQDTAQIQIQHGEKVFQQWCISCHGGGPGHPGTQALDFRYQGAVPGALQERTNLTPEIVKIFVRNGISIMPFFRKTEISDADLADLSAYLARNVPRQNQP